MLLLLHHIRFLLQLLRLNIIDIRKRGHSCLIQLQ
jgi:hypothetical protein